MNTLLVLYEDRHWRTLRPLTDVLPVPALAFGASTLERRWRRAGDAPLLGIEARAHAMGGWHEAPAIEATAPRRGDEVLVFNAAALPEAWLAAARAARSPALFLGEGRIVGARLPFEMLAPGLGRGEAFEAFLLGLGLPAVAVPQARFVTFPWDLVRWNADAIAADLAGEAGRIAGSVHAGAVLLAPERIVVEASAQVEPLAVLDARGGPIRIGADARVRPHTVVTGPCVVGERTQLLGGFISRSTFGPECRIAGEVEECVWQGYGNKRHHGFVGHSALGEWVNLGALTTTSDLKNNYGPVRVWIDGVRLDSGESKVGAVVGAHVKTGIGTLLPTGAAVGVGANLFGGGRLAPAAVASFAWWDGASTVEHRLDAFLATARTALARRGRALAPGEEAVLRRVFEETAKERRESVDRGGEDVRGTGIGAP